MSWRNVYVFAASAVLSASLVACGSSSSSSSSTASHATTSATTAASKSAPTASGSSVASGPVHATLRGANHAPKVGKPWRYVLRVTDAAGRPLTGTVDVEFGFGGQVVGHDTPPVHPLKGGLLQDTLEFPAQAVGYPLAFQTVVHTKAGSVTLTWPVTVSK